MRNSAAFTPPTADKPALFSHYDVETHYHEFGHMMHCMCGDTELVAHCGTSVTWDFVELPSQIQENWTREPEGIAQYAFHYETGEPIPAEMGRNSTPAATSCLPQTLWAATPTPTPSSKPTASSLSKPT